MRAIAITSLVLVMLLISLAAYLRLDHSGIGCTPWPQCYGNIGPERDVAGLPVRLIDDVTRAKTWATPLHRLVATVLGLLVLSLTIFAFREKRARLPAVSLLVLTVFLAVLGVKSGGLHSPAVVMGNLLGGFAMLAILGWIVFRKAGSGGSRSRLAYLSAIALLMLGLQIAIGGLTSANFAASACRSVPDCHGSWIPGSGLVTAFNLSRQHRLNESGFAIGGAERADIHKLHRLTAIATLFLIVAASLVAMHAGHDVRIIGAALIFVVCVEFAVGVLSVLADIPIGLAVAHNGLAAVLLLGLLKLHAESRIAPIRNP